MKNPAEFMLDVIGAGATASSETNWHDVWQRSNERQNYNEKSTKSAMMVLIVLLL